MNRTSVSLVVVTLATFGIALRAWISRSQLGALDSDEGVWGTMASHALSGELTAFYWGQTYGGTHEVILTAAVVALTGASVEALRVVPLLLFAVAAVLTWRVGLRTVGDPYARLGAAAFWVWSAYVVWKSTRAHGFYGAGLVLGLTVLLLALRLAERPERREFAALGLALGLGWWATPQVLVLAVPAIGWLVWRQRQALRHAWLAGASALVGALPWIVANVAHDWYSLRAAPPAGSPLERIHNLAVSTLPSALGARLPFTLQWLGGALVGVCVYAAVLALVAWTVLRRRSQLGPLVPVLLAFPVFYALSPYASLITEPRYLVLLGPVLALLAVSAFDSTAASAATACVLAVLSAAGIAILDRQETAVARADGIGVPADFDPLLRALDARGVDRAFADYWLSWRIVFESDERIVAVPSGDDAGRGARRDRSDPGRKGRYPPFYDAVASSRNRAYVFLDGSERELELAPRLVAAGYGRVLADGFVVYVRARRE